MSEAEETPEPAPPPRRGLGPFLIFGLVFAAPLFCWFTLLPGYSSQIRAGAFIYATVTILSGISRFAPT